MQRPSSSPDPIDVLRMSGLNEPALAARALLMASKQGRDEEALAVVKRLGAATIGHAGFLQAFGLAARNVGELAISVDALTRARRLSPHDPLIAHGAARARLEAGLPAVDDFLLCRRLAPADGSVIQGLAAALHATGDRAGAIQIVKSAVRENPLWVAGHETLVRLRSLAGDPDDLRSYGEAISATPPGPSLWMSLLGTLIISERFGRLKEAVAAARNHIGDCAAFDMYAAIAADETGETCAAGKYFDSMTPQDAAQAVWKVRSLIRRGELVSAATLADAGTQGEGGRILWPYVALLWRALDDPRWDWLEGDNSFVQVYDLTDRIGDLDALATRLRTLHRATHQPLDQSVRYGTQTDGPLFSRVDPEIVELTNAVRAAVAKYVSTLPPPAARHPLLMPRREKTRFAGSWSVRLTDGGHHSDHVHSQGWISSAFYVALPDTISAQSDAGWLTLGRSSSLLPDLNPFRAIEPRPGRLVLFPSTMWHGTQPFPSGERLTVAFDVAELH